MSFESRIVISKFIIKFFGGLDFEYLQQGYPLFSLAFYPVASGAAFCSCSEQSGRITDKLPVNSAGQYQLCVIHRELPKPKGQNNNVLFFMYGYPELFCMVTLFMPMHSTH